MEETRTRVERKKLPQQNSKNDGFRAAHLVSPVEPTRRTSSIASSILLQIKRKHLTLPLPLPDNNLPPLSSFPPRNPHHPILPSHPSMLDQPLRGALDLFAALVGRGVAEEGRETRLETEGGEEVGLGEGTVGGCCFVSFRSGCGGGRAGERLAS